MMEPKWVISMGVCASTGGMFNNYALVQGVDQVVPVDVYAPGCPPGPETLIHSILTLHEQIRRGEITRRRARPGPGPASTWKRSGPSSRLVLAGTPGGGRVSEGQPSAEPAGRRGDADAAQRARRPVPLLHGCPVARAPRPAHRPHRPGPLPGPHGGLYRDGFESCIGVSGVDYLTHPGRACRKASAAERFEVVVELLSFSRRERLRVRCQVPADDPVVPSLFDLWPGSEAHERETFDMFGISFTDHPGPHPDPDARGLGGPPAAQGLRHRPRAGAVQGGPQVTATRRLSRPAQGQDLRGCPGTARTREQTSVRELRAEVGGVLRLPEGVDLDSGRRQLRGARRRDDDPQPRPLPPLHPRGPAGDGRDPGRAGAADQARHRLPAHRHGEDGRGADVPAGRHQRDPDGLPVAVLQRAGVLPLGGKAGRHRGAPRAPSGSGC